MIMKTVCCVCRKAKGRKGWQGREVKQFKEVVFGVCPPCYTDTLSRIKENYTAAPMSCGFVVLRRAEVSS
jgi:hypothetical protein